MTDSGNNPFDKQISNRNYLSPLGFKLVISKIPKVDFLCQSASIPAISMGTAVQPTYLKDIPVPGDKCVYDDLTVRFIIDENMENYLSLNSWIVGLGQPESLQQYRQLEDIGPKQRQRAGTDPRYNYQYIFNQFYNGEISSDGVILPSVEPSVFELKFPNKDIRGKVL